MSKLHKLYTQSDEFAAYSFYCPGCECHHQIWYKECQCNRSFAWEFNGNIDKPTFAPSLLIKYPVWINDVKSERVCHSFIKDGMIQYLSDCTHKLANQTIEIPEYE
jgi:hypothetical protein